MQRNTNKEKLNLNGVQKNIIEGMFSFFFDGLNECSNDFAIEILKAALRDVSESEIDKYKESGWYEYIEFVRRIFQHPYPENRAESYPYVGQEEGFCMYKLEKKNIKSLNSVGDIELYNGRIILKKNIIRNANQDTYIIAKENEGLLSLTAREENYLPAENKEINNTPPVDKESVINYITYLINQEIFKQEERWVPYLGRAPINMTLDNFLSSLTNFNFHFIDDTRQLYESLKRNKTIKEISFRCINPKHSINLYFADYLAETKTLESIELNCLFPKENSEKLSGLYIDYIAYGLRYNTSITQLKIIDQSIEDDGFLILLNALSNNMKIKLSQIVLSNIAISDRGAIALTEFIKCHPTLKSVLIESASISENYLKEIQMLSRKDMNQHDEKSESKFSIKQDLSNKFLSKQSFFSQLERKLNFSNYVLGQNLNWHLFFQRLLRAHVLVQLVVPNINLLCPDEVHFYVALKHSKPINLKADKSNGVHFYADGRLGHTNDHLIVDIFLSAKNEFYLNENGSILDIHVKNLNFKSEPELDEKMRAILNPIHLIVDNIFAKGISKTFNGDFHRCSSWLSNPDEAFHEMENRKALPSNRYSRSF